MNQLSPVVVVRLAILAGLSIVATTAGAAGSTGESVPWNGSSSLADSFFHEPDLEEALAELQEAGVLPVGEELRLLLESFSSPDGGAVPGGPGDTLAGDGVPFSADLRARCQPFAVDGCDPRVALRAECAPFSLRGTYRDRSGSSRSVRGSLNLISQRLDLRFGDLGYTWAYGLLCAAPGRSPSLAAGQRLPAPRYGPSSGGSEFDPHAVTGVAMLAGSESWSVGALAGAPQAGPGDSESYRSLFAVQHRSDTYDCGVLVSRSGDEQGASLAGRWQKHWLRGSWESAVWSRSEPGTSGRGWAGTLGWAGSRSLVAEGFLSGSFGGPVPTAGRRPPGLPAVDGRAWGLRLGFQPRTAAAARLLLSRGQGLEYAGSGDYLNQSLADLEVRWRLDRALWVAARWRRKVEHVSTWSTRFPWETALPAPGSRRMVFSVSVGGRQGPRTWQLLVRTQSDAAEPAERTRSLAQASGRWAVAPGTGVRFAWANAWGGDADLVSAIAPLNGFVLPRHWGHWRSEIMLGAEHRWSLWLAQIACSRRIPAAEPPPGPQWSVWAQSQISW